MAWLMCAVVVETDCPDCDLIEQHPLDVVRRAKVLTCHGCGHRYVAEASGVLEGIGGEKLAALRTWAAETAYMRKPRQPLVLHVCATSLGMSALRAPLRPEAIGRRLLDAARKRLGATGALSAAWRGGSRSGTGLAEGWSGGV